MLRKTTSARALALAALFSILVPGALSAQTEVDPKATGGVILPAPSYTETDDATTLAVNPANMGFLDSWSLVYAGAWAAEQRHLAGQGHGFFLAFPAGPFGLGVATEFMTPPDEIQDWQGLDRRARFSLGLSMNPVRSLGIGFAYRTLLGYDLGTIHTFDIGLTIRPINHLALAFVLGDAGTPDADYARTYSKGGVLIPERQEEVPRRFGVGLTIRPFGTDRLALGGELNYHYGTRQDYVVNADNNQYRFVDVDYRRTDVLGLLSWMIVDGLQLKTRFGAEGIRDDDIGNGYYLDVALSVDSRRFPIGLQAASYFKLGPDEDTGFEAVSWAVRLSGDEPPSLPFHLPPSRGVLFRLENRPGPYGETALTSLMERVTDDAAVDVVLIRPDAGTLSLDQSLNLRRRVAEIKSSGKKTVCYLTEATGPVYMACAGADEIWINPAGGVRLSGISTKSVYFKRLLDKIGVEADIVRVGEYKSAPESLTEAGPTKPASHAMNRYMDAVHAHLVSNLQKDRGLNDRESSKAALEGGPYTASEAMAAKLVDKIVPADLLQDELAELMGSPVILNDKYGARPLRHRSYLDSPAVAVVHIEGDIVDGESVHIPFFEVRMTGAKTMTEELRRLGENPDIKAVVLRINSPGGSALASDMIWREVMSLRKKKPVVASLGAVAASGGYYIASAADYIYAEPTTLTGSIGIFYGKADVSGLLDKVGIDTATYKRGEHSDMESWTRAYTPEERRKLLGQITEFYNLFLDRVAEGRGHGFTREIVDKRGRGRIWSGYDAKHHLLVDDLGGYQEALNHARAMGFVAKGTKVFHVPRQKKGIIHRLAKMVRAAVDQPSPLESLLKTPEFKSTMKGALPFAVSDHGAPQARLPFALIEE